MADRLCCHPLGPSLVGLCLPSGEDAAILAANSGFHDLASKITRHLFLALRTENLRASLTASLAASVEAQTTTGTDSGGD